MLYLESTCDIIALTVNNFMVALEFPSVQGKPLHPYKGLNTPREPPLFVKNHASYNAKFTVILSHYHNVNCCISVGAVYQLVWYFVRIP